MDWRDSVLYYRLHNVKEEEDVTGLTCGSPKVVYMLPKTGSVFPHLEHEVCWWTGHPNSLGWVCYVTYKRRPQRVWSYLSVTPSSYSTRVHYPTVDVILSHCGSFASTYASRHLNSDPIAWHLCPQPNLDTSISRSSSLFQRPFIQAHLHSPTVLPPIILESDAISIPCLLSSSPKVWYIMCSVELRMTRRVLIAPLRHEIQASSYARCLPCIQLWFNHIRSQKLQGQRLL